MDTMKPTFGFLALLFIYCISAAMADVQVFGDMDDPRAVPFSAGIGIIDVLADKKMIGCSMVRVTRGAPPTRATYEVSLPVLLATSGKDFALQDGDIVFVAEHIIGCMGRAQQLKLATLVTEYRDLRVKNLPLPKDWQAPVDFIGGCGQRRLEQSKAEAPIK